MSLLRSLLPQFVSCEEAFEDIAGAQLYPEEEPLVARAVGKRRREFTTTRHLARLALARHGHGDGPLLTGPGREPLWPSRVVGSLTHCDGYRGAAVAHRTSVASVGIDAEPHAPLPPDVVRQVVLPQERAAWSGLSPDVAWDRLLFSAKESVYKAWYPLTGRWLGFEDAVLRLQPTSSDALAGEFEATLLADSVVLDGQALCTFRGRYLVSKGLVLTAVLVRWPAENRPLPC